MSVVKSLVYIIILNLSMYVVTLTVGVICGRAKMTPELK